MSLGWALIEKIGVLIKKKKKRNLGKKTHTEESAM